MVPIIVHNSDIYSKLSFRSVSISLSSVIEKIGTVIDAVQHFAGIFSLDAKLPKQVALSDLFAHLKIDCIFYWSVFAGQCLVPGKKPVTPSRCGQSSMYTSYHVLIRYAKGYLTISYNSEWITQASWASNLHLYAYSETFGPKALEVNELAYPGSEDYNLTNSTSFQL